MLDGVQFIGGIGSAALKSKATLILPNEGTIIAQPDLYLPRLREDGNVRDMDVLVLTDDEARIAEVEGIAEDTVGTRLDNSIFGFRNGEHVKRQLEHPVLGWKALKTFVSDRYVNEDGSMDKVLFPFGVEIDRESLASHQLVIGGATFPVPSAPATLVNYASRSNTGLRAKDAEKVQEMAANIFEQVPDYADWISTGPGATQLELGRIMHSLQGPASIGRAATLVLGGAVRLEPIPIRQLLEHEAFLLRDRDPKTQENALALARVKSMAVRRGESYEEVVRLYQKWAERLLGSVTKNT